MSETGAHRNGRNQLGGGSLGRRVFAVFGVIVLLETGYLLALSYLLDSSQKQLYRARQARETLATIARFSSALQSSNTALIDELRSVKPSTSFADMFSYVPAAFKEMQANVEREGGDASALAKLAAEVDDGLRLVKKVVTTSKGAPNTKENSDHHIFVMQLLDNSRTIDADLADLTEKYSVMEREASRGLFLESDILFYTALYSGFLVNALVGVILYLNFVRSFTNKLNAVAERMQFYSTGKCLPQPLSGNDEITKLDDCFRRTAAKLLAQKTKESIILTHVSSFICSINKDYFITTVPERDREIWGYTADDLIGKRFFSLVKDDNDYNSYASLQALTSGELKSITFESGIEPRIGSGLPEDLQVSWSASRTENGSIVCIAHDITERKRAQSLMRRNEEQFRSIIESLPLAVIATKDDLKIEGVNPAALLLSQYQQTELIGASIALLFGERFASADSLPVSEDEGDRVFLNAIKCKYAGMVPVDLSISRYRLNDEQRLLFSFYDVSARHEIEMAKRDFVSMIAHDLRSPLLAIDGTLRMIEGGSADFMEESEKTITTLIALINDFLDLGKLEAGQKMLVRRQVSLEDLKQSLLSGFEDRPHSLCDLQIDNQPTTVLNIDLPRMVDTIVYLCRLQMSIKAAQLNEFVKAKIRTVNLHSNFCLYIYCAGAKLPNVIKENCSEGYGLIEEAGYSGLHLALSRAVIAAHGGSLGVECVYGAEAFKITLPSFGTRL